MRGSAEHITLLPIQDEESSTGRTALEVIFGAFKTFDAHDAKCFKPEDKEALLGVIESGTGSIDAFNHTVQEIFASIESSRARPRKVCDAPAAAESHRPRSSSRDEEHSKPIEKPITRVKSSKIEVLTVEEGNALSYRAT